MIKLVNREEIKKFDKIFKRVFQSKDAFGEMFQEDIKKRIILCPTDGYFLTNEQFFALLKTLKEIGEDKFLLSIIEGRNNDNWLIENNTSYDEYSQLPIYLENAIFSTQGEWGLLISHEEYAVFGGDEQLISNFLSIYLKSKEDITNFIDMWNYNKENYKTDLSWMKLFKKHMNIEM